MMHSSFYIDYLNSETWRKRRYAALEAVEFRCQLCGETDSLEVHHLTYERLGNEDPSDLFVICKGHHWIEDTKRKEPGRITEPQPKVKPAVVLCYSVKRWLKKAQELKHREHDRGYLTKASRERLIELENKYQDHIKRCQVCNIP
jgi:hypothetical protein